MRHKKNRNGSSSVAALLAADIAVPAGFWFAGMTALPLAFIGAGVVFLPAFVFLRVINPREKKNARASFVLSKVIRLETGEDRRSSSS